jgi:hypothetical protein
MHQESSPSRCLKERACRGTRLLQASSPSRRRRGTGDTRTSRQKRRGPCLSVSARVLPSTLCLPSASPQPPLSLPTASPLHARFSDRPCPSVEHPLRSPQPASGGLRALHGQPGSAARLPRRQRGPPMGRQGTCRLPTKLLYEGE